MAADQGMLLYLSRRKLDILPDAGKLPLWRRGLAVLGWLKVTLPTPVAEISLSVPKQDLTDIERVKLLWTRLKDQEKVGSVDEPRDWFSGRHQVRYQTFQEMNPPILYLTGETEHTLFAMGGSSQHLRTSQAPIPASSTPLHLFESDVVRTLAQFRGVKVDEERPIDSHQWATDIEEIFMYSTGYHLECQFLAMTEKFKPSRAGLKQRLLGSPLIVTYTTSASPPRA